MLKEKVSSLPESSGCYLFTGKTGKILYIGKAKNLKKRVSSYLKENLTIKTAHLMGKVFDLSFIMTKTEAEALILENNLIKKHKPKYNIRLRDDKSYPYIGININHQFPRLLFLRSRGQRKKGLKVFGPFPHGSGLSHILRILNKIYMLRDCTDRELAGRDKPCLLYQMKQCSAPCVGLISEGSYRENIHKVEAFLKGKREGRKILGEIQSEMLLASEKEEFERAAILRDSHSELKTFFEKHTRQSVQKEMDFNIDLIAFSEGKEEVDLCFYFVRGGELRAEESFYFESDTTLENAEEQVLSFVYQYYDGKENLPDKLIGSFSKGGVQILKDLFQEEMQILSSQSENYKSLLEKVVEHAQNNASQREDKRNAERRGLTQLQKILSLKKRPKVLECYDIAIWQGKSPTASLIYFEEGKPKKERYRHYHLKERVEGNNDFAMMAEVFERRVKKGSFPDVFVLDGGKGQVQSVQKVLKRNGIEIPVIGLAKSRVLTDELRFQREVSHSEERLVLEGRKNAIPLRKYSELFKILTFMRDEAHRFSRRLHHHKEKKRIFGK